MKNPESKKKLQVLTLLAFALIWQSSCTTTPKIVADKTPSFDGTNQNSGFLGFSPDGRGIISEHDRQRYNALVAQYGSIFAPPLKPDAGLVATNENWLIDQEHLVDFATMNRWRKSQATK